MLFLIVLVLSSVLAIGSLGTSWFTKSPGASILAGFNAALAALMIASVAEPSLLLLGTQGVMLAMLLKFTWDVLKGARKSVANKRSLTALQLEIERSEQEAIEHLELDAVSNRMSEIAEEIGYGVSNDLVFDAQLSSAQDAFDALLESAKDFEGDEESAARYLDDMEAKLKEARKKVQEAPERRNAPKMLKNK